MKTLPLLALLFVACGPVPAQTLAPLGTGAAVLYPSTQRFVDAVAALPTCATADSAEPITFERAGFCTLKRCDYACCNLCGWQAKQRDARVINSLLFTLPQDAYECELGEWQAEANRYLFDLTAGCVVR